MGQVSKNMSSISYETILNNKNKQKTGSLFLITRDVRPLTLSQLKYHICSLITEADPDNRANAHEIRK